MTQAQLASTLNILVEPLNILILHRLGDPLVARDFLVKHTYMLQRNCPENNLLYHDVDLPLPAFVKDVPFDAILFDVTVLCLRWAREDLFRGILSSLEFVRASTALKMAFPQDEYDCHLTLDEWMCDWNIDTVYSVLPEHAEVLYPAFSKAGDIRKAFTGYLNDDDIGLRGSRFDDRPIDIGYRARKLPPYFGRIGENKWRIAEVVRQKGEEAGLRLDIAVGENSSLVGPYWLKFLGQCKFTLGANSGSSLLDPRGLIQKKVRAYITANPNAPFEEVEKACFPGLDGVLSMTAISPRNLEAGLLESCQILVDGTYSEILEPYEHYIPLREDASNFAEVLGVMQNIREVNRIRQACRTRLLEYKPLRASCHAREIVDSIRSSARTARPSGASDRGRQAIARYQSSMHSDYETLWRKQRIKRKIRGYFSENSRIIEFLRRFV